eukprot:15474071-Alexandrium_andersonii.AAC.1
MGALVPAIGECAVPFASTAGPVVPASECRPEGGGAWPFRAAQSSRKGAMKGIFSLMRDRPQEHPNKNTTGHA